MQPMTMREILFEQLGALKESLEEGMISEGF